jgi:hypothetical protein
MAEGASLTPLTLDTPVRPQTTLASPARVANPIFNIFSMATTKDIDTTCDRLPVSATLLITLINVILERFPLYKMGEWARERRLLDEGLADCLNDDRVGRALDRLFDC